MPRWLHQSLVLTIAFALVASTVAWRQCTAMQFAAAMSAAAAPADHAHDMNDHGSHDHGSHHRLAMPQDRASAEPAVPTADDHGCLKCCSMCTVANMTLPVLADAVTFRISPAEFFVAYEDLTGNTIAVDPGIPKRII